MTKRTHTPAAAVADPKPEPRLEMLGIIRQLIWKRRVFMRRGQKADKELDAVMAEGNGWTKEAAALSEVINRTNLDAAAAETAIRTLSAQFNANRPIRF